MPSRSNSAWLSPRSNRARDEIATTSVLARVVAALLSLGGIEPIGEDRIGKHDRRIGIETAIAGLVVRPVVDRESAAAGVRRIGDALSDRRRTQDRPDLIRMAL